MMVDTEIGNTALEQRKVGCEKDSTGGWPCSRPTAEVPALKAYLAAALACVAGASQH